MLVDAEDLAPDEGPSLLVLVAKAADLCLKPWHHGVRLSGEPPHQLGDCSDAALVIEARDGAGARCPDRDLELEIYRSGDDLNLMLSSLNDQLRPVLWHGSHAVWMDGTSGERCERPVDGVALEALCRRLRALLNPSDPDNWLD